MAPRGPRRTNDPRNLPKDKREDLPSNWYKSDTSHNTYTSWRAMHQRCYYPEDPRFEHYGGRGIEVCERWRQDYDAFVEDMGYRPEGCTLDRIDIDGHYTPENCRWADQETQDNNRRHCKHYDWNGQRLTLAQLASRSGVPYGTLRARVLRYGWDLGRAVSTPVRRLRPRVRS